MTGYEKVRTAEKSVRERTDFKPDIAIVLGSGLGALAEQIENPIVIPTQEIACYPKSTVSGHAGKLVFGRIGNKNVAIVSGRVHYYEGYEMDEVVLPVRLMILLGAKTVILTNAAGGINPAFHSGDFMILTGQIAQFVPSPLRGANDESFGPRFPDMSEIYDKNLVQKAVEAAKEIGLEVKKGVYLQASGPNYESPEEVRAFGRLGADAVGMSTAVEAIAAKHMGSSVIGISLITNMAAGIQNEKLSHEEVKKAADERSAAFVCLVKRLSEKL